MAKKKLPGIKKENLQVLGIIFLLTAILVFSGVVYYHNKTITTRIQQTEESPSTDMKMLPPEVKKQVEQASLSATFRVPILMYHYIEHVEDKKDKERQLLDVPPEVFENQIISLQKAGYTFMTASELGEVLDGTKPLPPKPVLLTFDDGHRDFYINALPLLEKYHIKATQYIITGFTGGTDFMTEDQVRSVAESGLIEIGAHTEHHIALKHIPVSTMKKEIIGSKEALEKLYHLHIVSFAYPAGAFDTNAIQVVKDAGFTTAVSTIPGIEDSDLNRFFIYRLRPGSRSGADLITFLSQYK